MKEGDIDAYVFFFDLYAKRLYYFAFGYLKTEEEAEEVVQETFLKIWERREHLDSELCFSAYLFKIAFNFVQKKLNQHFKDENLKSELLNVLSDEDDCTNASVNYHSLMQHANCLVSNLPTRQREVLSLRLSDGLSFKEIAAHLDLSKKTVEAHYTAAIKVVRRGVAREVDADLLLFSIFFEKR